MKQETQVAKLHGGYRNKGSGALSHAKSDASVRDKYRIENKYTTGKSIRIPLSDLHKLRGECEVGQMPIYQIDFKEPNTHITKEQWVLVPLEEWEKRIV